MGDDMYELSLNEKDITFNSLEKEIYKYVCQKACALLEEVLTHLDRRLMNERDSKVYRNKGLKHTCIKTVMGNVEFDRRIYEYTTNEGKKAYKFLLDEYLKMDTIGHISTNLVEKIIDNAINVSYRKTSENIEKLCNQKVSHTAVWDIVQKLGSRIEAKEERKVALNKNGKLDGGKEVDVLFQEQDGIWINMQGEDRPKKGKSKKRELKLDIVYEGWRKRQGSNDSYEVVNKTAYASFGSSKKFKSLTDATIAEIYNLDEVKLRILNGDGASWIKSSLEEDGVHYQLDPFHKSQAVIRAVKDKKEARRLINLLNNGKVNESLQMIVDIMIRDSNDDKVLEKLEKLYNYLVENKSGLIPYHLRKDIKLPKPPEGLEYRHLGTMEHNICDILAKRMKHRKMSWSIKGANNLSKILAEKASRRIYPLIYELCSDIISAEKLEKIVETITLSASQVYRSNKKSKIYPMPQSSLPFTGCAKTNGRKAIRNIFEDRCFSQLIYR